ncbi:glycosyltransferase [Quadrisphaera oryzae]|uniref:glycosyltransferase n=1 Tax=Quadrisphaera TaxID=317661 RepID=UPI001647B57B|nr:glycosyltransferase [Quadrisphaera sp. RL12-1S]MBC3761712.1 glycosyltransferase [Quadrisphaera sp. RL12-1S]
MTDQRWTVVHDFAYVHAGAERVTQVLANRVVPGAPLLAIGGRSSVLDGMGIDGGWRTVVPADRMAESTYRSLAPLYPALLRRRRPLEGDAICSSYAFAHLVPVRGRRVVYCHTPLRQVWSGYDSYSAHASRVQRTLLEAVARRLRASDLAGARSAAAYIASSRAVADRIHRYYGRTAPVISPPIDTAVFHPGTGVDTEHPYYLWVGRIVEPYKRLEMTIEAFRGSPHRLVVAGEGRDRARLEASAPANVEFRGWQRDHELAALYRGAQAVIFPSEDDFGLVPVESMACGTPSVALAAGGAAETVAEGETGTFFTEQRPEHLRRALDRAAAHGWDRNAIAARGRRHGTDAFVAAVRQVLASLPDDGRSGATAPITVDLRSPRPAEPHRTGRGGRAARSQEVLP